MVPRNACPREIVENRRTAQTSPAARPSFTIRSCSSPAHWFVRRQRPYFMSFVLIPGAAEAGHGRERREKQRQGPGNEVRLVCILMADRWGALSQIKSLVGIGVCERR